MSDESLDFVEQSGTESAWMCCCPKPYEACAKNQRDSACDAAMAKFMGSLSKTSSRVNIQEGLQSVRAALVESADSCKSNFASATPVSKCGSDIGKQRSIGRADVFCETVTWQWEELGDGNADEFRANGCPVPTVDLQSVSGNSRKGNKLDPSELPS